MDFTKYRIFLIWLLTVIVIGLIALVVYGNRAEEIEQELGMGLEVEHRYYVQEHEGRVAIFHATDRENPRDVYNVYVRNLPEYDQDLLSNGVLIEGEDALKAIVEDLIS